MVYRPKDVDDKSSSFPLGLDRDPPCYDDDSCINYGDDYPPYYYDDDSCINYADDSYINCDDDSCIIDDDSSEFNKQKDLYDSTFNNGSDNEHQAKEDTPTPAERSGGFLEIAKSTVDVLGGRSVGFLKMAKSTVGVLGERSGGFLETAKSTVGVLGERSGGFLETAKTVAVVGGTAIAAGWSLYCLLSSDSSPSPFPSSSSEKEKKMMKAPGRNGERILRKPFEDNPAEYYRELRNNNRNSKGICTE